MRILEPKVELWLQEDAKAHVARCARVCYGRESGNDEATIKRLIDDNHWSMFRHESVYAIIPSNKVLFLWSEVMSQYMKCPYINWINFDDKFYIVTNGNFLLDIKEENPVLYKWLIKYRVTTNTFEKEAKIPSIREMIRYTFKVTTQISTSRELNRVSPNNIAERSTRYVYEDGSICRPHWMSKEEANEFNNNHQAGMTTVGRNYINSCIQSFGTYKDLIEINGMHRQDARGVLPLDTATECVYTYSWREWEEIIKKRVYNTTGKAHPNTTIICKLIEQKLNELGYKVRTVENY